jgi:putative transposase
MQDVCIKSFQRGLRDECLNEHVFLTRAEARETIEAWSHDYNHLRPQVGLGALTRLGTRPKPCRVNLILSG